MDALFECRSITATTHGRFLVRGGPPSRMLIGFHGYAENAEIHLRELSLVPGTENWTLVAVQALHSFYKLKTNEVVASWMTRLDREVAIADNLEYVRAVVAELAPTGKVVFAGFSQGAATAWRAAAAISCNGVIALGGDIPPDVTAQESVHLPLALIGRGTTDEWYDRKKFNNDLNFLRKGNYKASACEFSGGHVWTDEFRVAAGLFLSALAEPLSNG